MLGITFFLVMGVLFGGLASLTAYIIFYREYIHHLKHEKTRSLALKGALVAFAFFIGLSITSGYVITHFIVAH